MPLQAQQDDPCQVVSAYAEAVMTSRQVSRSMADMMQDVSKGSLHSQIIISAFESEPVKGRLERKDVVNEFGSQWYLSCVKGEVDPKNVFQERSEPTS